MPLITAARKTGSWKDAHAAAQEVGYKGSVDALGKLMDAEKAEAPAPAEKLAPTAPKPAAKKPAAKQQKPKASPKSRAKPVAAQKRYYDAKAKAPTAISRRDLDGRGG